MNVSKKKRRYKKKQSKKKYRANDCHHIFWTRRSYGKSPWTQKLRSHPYCIVFIPKDTIHAAIHREMDGVPLPNDITCESVVRELNRLWAFGAIKDSDSLAFRIDLLVFMMKYVADDTVEALERQKNISLENSTSATKKDG